MQTITPKASLAEVIRPRGPFVEGGPLVYPAEYEPGSLQAELVDKAASQLRDIYSAGTARIPYNDNDPGPFMAACASTYEAALEVTEVLPPAQGSIALALFKRLWTDTFSVKPTTPRAQVEMQMAAIEAARRLAFMFSAQQAPLALH
jgi:hypothetical protein